MALHYRGWCERHRRHAVVKHVIVRLYYLSKPVHQYCHLKGRFPNDRPIDHVVPFAMGRIAHVGTVQQRSDKIEACVTQLSHPWRNAKIIPSVCF